MARFAHIFTTATSRNFLEEHEDGNTFITVLISPDVIILHHVIYIRTTFTCQLDSLAYLFFIVLHVITCKTEYGYYVIEFNKVKKCKS